MKMKPIQLTALCTLMLGATQAMASEAAKTLPLFKAAEVQPCVMQKWLKQKRQ